MQSRKYSPISLQTKCLTQIPLFNSKIMTLNEFIAEYNTIYIYIYHFYFTFSFLNFIYLRLKFGRILNSRPDLSISLAFLLNR